MDDFAFGADVWGTPGEAPALPTPAGLPKHRAISRSPSPSPAPSPSRAEPPVASPPPGKDDFDDFDDFDTAPSGAPTESQDDDFGDFGDFGEAEDMATPADFGGDAKFAEPQNAVAGPSHPAWEPVRLDPLPSRAELSRQVNALLEPVWPDDDLAAVTTQEEIRQVEGVSQILVTAESRDLYNSLFHTPPPTRPPNWTRSRIRRQHLITLGIPVNLDEVLPPSQANGKPMPTLEVSTRPMSAPPGPRPSPRSSTHQPGTGQNSRAGTPRNRSPQSNVKQLGLGPKPELDEGKINQLLQLESDNLALLPVSKLDAYLNEIRSQTVNASTLLTHLLQTRDALQQDSETYNGLIAELVGEAQKMKTGKNREPTKRGSLR